MPTLSAPVGVVGWRAVVRIEEGADVSAWSPASVACFLENVGELPAGKRAESEIAIEGAALFRGEVWGGGSNDFAAIWLQDGTCEDQPWSDGRGYSREAWVAGQSSTFRWHGRLGSAIHYLLDDDGHVGLNAAIQRANVWYSFSTDPREAIEEIAKTYGGNVLIQLEASNDGIVAAWELRDDHGREHYCRALYEPAELLRSPRSWWYARIGVGERPLAVIYRADVVGLHESERVIPTAPHDLRIAYEGAERMDRVGILRLIDVVGQTEQGGASKIDSEPASLEWLTPSGVIVTAVLLVFLGTTFRIYRLSRMIDLCQSQRRSG